MPIFRPSAQVTLWLRVDEINDTTALRSRLTATAPATPANAVPEASTTSPDARLADLVETMRQVRNFTDETAFLPPFPSREVQLARLQAEYDQIMELRSNPPDQAVPGVFAAASPDARFVRGGVIPADVEIERNSFRTADTAKITFDWRDAPFDPRICRAVGVEITIGVVSADDYERGIRGERAASGLLRSVVQRREGDEILSNATRFVGWVDEWNVEFSEEGDTVSVECRDFTALFLDTPLVGGVDLTLPIDRALQAFIDQFPALRGIPVIFGDVLDPNPGAAPIIANGLPPQRKARRGRVAKQARSGDQKMNVWDHITDVCASAGFVPIVRDYELRIARPRNLYVNAAPPRRMVYGRNLKNLQYTRKIGGVKVPTIEVRSYDPSIGRTRWARWPVPTGQRTAGVIGVTNPPTQAARANETSVSGGRPDERIQTMILRATNDPAQMTTIARGLFEQIGRQELEGNFKTASVSSWNAQKNEENVSLDLLSLDAGDAVEILVAPKELQRPNQTPSSVAELQALGLQARIDYLRRLGWSASVAKRFAELQDAAGFAPIFRVQNVNLSWSVEDGIEISCDFINFVVPSREDPDSAVSIAQETDASSTSTEVHQMTRQQRREEARALERVSFVRNQLTSFRQVGLIDDATYQKRMQALDDIERRRRQEMRGDS